MSGFAADYIQVNERIIAFREKYPDGCLQTEIIELSDSRVTMRAYAYRTPDDTRPGIGHSTLGIPGLTPYTKGSELENCETSAWGRALAALGFEVKRAVASAEEVASKAAPARTPPAAPQPPQAPVAPPARPSVPPPAEALAKTPAEAAADVAAKRAERVEAFKAARPASVESPVAVAGLSAQQFTDAARHGGVLRGAVVKALGCPPAELDARVAGMTHAERGELATELNLDWQGPA